MVATLTSAVLTPIGFDGIDTYSFDIGGSAFTIFEGTGKAVEAFITAGSRDWSETPIHMSMDANAIALLTVNGDSLELLIPFDATGTSVAGIGLFDLNFSQQQIAMAGSLAVPEPGSLSLAALGLAALAATRRRAHG